MIFIVSSYRKHNFITIGLYTEEHKDKGAANRQHRLVGKKE